MSKLTPRLAHMRRVLLVAAIIFLAITANRLQPPSTAAAVNFVVTNSDNSGPGSLRDAINNANVTAGADTITFNIPGSGVKVINLLEPLPEITEQVVIDASTQTGYAGMPLVELDGALAGNNNGLVIRAGGSTVRGLAIVRLEEGSKLQRNFIGTDITGTLPLSNGEGGVFAVRNPLIGGTVPEARNVISANNGFANIILDGSIDSGATVQGNYIGTDVTGSKAVRPSTSVGIRVFGNNNLIGGLVPGAQNVISGMRSA